MLELRVLTGLHRGAALPLEGDTIRIGSGPENDIVLLDPGMPTCASAIYRSGESDWQYRSTQAGGEEFDPTPGGTALVAGARWFAGPVLIGCEEEGTSWNAQPLRSDTSHRGAEGQSSFPARRKKAPVAATLVVTCAIVLAALAAAWAVPRRPYTSARPPNVHAALALDVAASPAPRNGHEATNTRPAPVRVVSATLYPNEPINAPPFSIRSAKSGPYGFVVTDDGHVLTVGSRWRAFTLVRIEPGRAVFAGPHAAELTW